jgi:hypothetical protein
MHHDVAESEAGLGEYGDAVDMAIKVPTLSGVLVTLFVAALVWAWRKSRRLDREA